MAGKKPRKVVRIDTYETEQQLSVQESSRAMIRLTTTRAEDGRSINEAVITSWQREIDSRRKRYKLTHAMLAAACGVSKDTIEDSWSKRIPMARRKDAIQPERRVERTRSDVINLAYALQLSRTEADELLSKHAGYTRLLPMYDGDMVDIYLFEHRDLNQPVEDNEYNRLHELYMGKLARMDAAGGTFAAPEGDRDFYQYCIRARENAVDCKKKTIDFINSYIDPNTKKPNAFCKYMADGDLIAEGKRACRNWRTMSFEEWIHEGEKYCRKNDLTAEERTPAELAELGKQALKASETRFEREWLILLGLKLQMPRALIDHMLEISGNHRLYAKDFLESWLIYYLDSTLLEQPAFFGLNSDASVQVIGRFEENYLNYQSRNDSVDVRLHQVIYNQTMKRDECIGRMQNLPLWLNPAYLKQYDPDAEEEK